MSNYDIDDAFYYLDKVNMLLGSKGRAYRYAINDKDAENDLFSLTYGVMRTNLKGKNVYRMKDYVFINIRSEELCHCLMGMFHSLAMH